MKDLSRLIICIIAIAIAGIFTIAAQDTQQYDFSAVRINGLEIGKFYTREQYLEALGGQPYSEGDEAYHYLTYKTAMALAPTAGLELIDIKKTETKYDLFGYSAWQGYEGFYFASFFIHSDKYAINDYVRVGDPVSTSTGLPREVRMTRRSNGAATLGSGTMTTASSPRSNCITTDSEHSNGG